MRAIGIGAISTLALVTAAGCVPPRSELFGPVGQAVQQRTGVTPEWRDGWERSPAVDRRVRETLGKPLGAEDAALLAILNSPALQASYAELGVVGGKVGAARGFRNPEVDVELIFPLEDGHSVIELAAVQDVSQLLTILPRTRGADAELRAARRQAVALTVDLAARARVAFYEVAAAEQVLGMRRTIAEAATASATLARSLHAAGNITDLTLAREELFEEEAAIDVSDAVGALAAARERLNALIGLHGDETAWTVAAGALAEPPAALPDLAGFEQEVVSASLDLEAARWRIEAAGQAIGVARTRSFVPELGVGVAAKQEGEGWGVGPVVTFAIPLWDWGQGERRAAWAKLRALQQRYTALAGEVRAAARASRAQLGAAHTRAVRMRARILPLRERMAELGVLEYNAMNLDAFELLVMRREHVATEVRYVDALLDYWVAATHVEQLRAGSLPSGWGAAPGGASHGDEPTATEGGNERDH